MKNEQSEATPVNVPETPAPEVIETAVAPATDEATWMPDPGWVPEPAQVPNIFERLADTARSWLKTQKRNGWPLMVFLMLDSAGGWMRICSSKIRKAAQELQAQHEACRDVINNVLCEIEHSIHVVGFELGLPFLHLRQNNLFIKFVELSFINRLVNCFFINEGFHQPIFAPV
jgi:hypothetical protein